MGDRKLSLALGFILVLGLFGFAVYELFSLGFETGESCPVYSSFRSDPLGTRAFYRSLDALPGVRAERNLKSLDRLETGPGAALLLLNATISKDPEFLIQHLEGTVSAGARLVIAFYPIEHHPWIPLDEEDVKEPDKKTGPSGEEPTVAPGATVEPGSTVAPAEEPAPKPRRKSAKRSRRSRHVIKISSRPDFGPEPPEDKADKPQDEPDKPDRDVKRRDDGDEEEEDQFEIKMVSIEDRWGFETYFVPDDGSTAAVFAERGEAGEAYKGLPEKIRWRSPLRFIGLSPKWRVIYRTAGGAVAAERDFGGGTIVLVADSYPFSNEALLKDREPGLLAWSVGSARRVIFDESHLGVVEQRGLMMLMRSYGLDWLLGALGVVALLFIWNNASSLTPKRTDGVASGDAVRGLESRQGLVNLLRRSIAPRRVLTICLEEYHRSFPREAAAHDREARARSVIQAEQAKPPGRTDLAAAYRAIAKILDKRG